MKQESFALRRERFKGNYTKDLSKIEGIDLSQALLIEDDYSFSASGQEENLLFVPRTCEINFRSMKKRADTYGANSTRMLRTFLVHETAKEWEQNSQRIVLQKSCGKYFCQFPDLKNPLQSHKIEVEGPVELIKKLDLLPLKTNNESHFLKIDDPSLLDEIAAFVESKGGFASKICRQVNRIYYVAGLIFSLIEEATETGIPVARLLSNKQYKKEGESLSIDGRALIKNDLLYIKGLNKLREVNPALEFTSPKNYSAACSAPMSEEMRQFLKQTMAMEAESCLVQ